MENETDKGNMTGCEFEVWLKSKVECNQRKMYESAQGTEAYYTWRSCRWAAMYTLELWQDHMVEINANMGGSSPSEDSPDRFVDGGKL